MCRGAGRGRCRRRFVQVPCFSIASLRYGSVLTCASSFRRCSGGSLVWSPCRLVWVTLWCRLGWSRRWSSARLFGLGAVVSRGCAAPFWPACARWVSCARCVAAMAAADVVVVGAGALIDASSSRFDSVTACLSLVHGLWRARLCLMGAPPCGRVPCCCAAAGHCPGRLCSLRGAA